MKLLIPLILLVILSCQPHIPNSPIKKIGFEGKSILYDTLSLQYWANGVQKIDSLQLSFEIAVKGNYRITINGSQFDFALHVGDTAIAFGWDQFVLGSEIVCTAYEQRVPSDYTELRIPVSYSESISVGDPLLSFCWHLEPSEISFVEKYQIDTASHVHVASVWKTNRGAGVKVAILDNGIQPLHEDIADNVIATWDVSENSPTIVSDGGYHGTAVAGMAGAVSGNGIGISGIAPEASLILVKFDVNYASDADIIRAFTFAKDQGAQVINCSWGTYAVSEAVEGVIQEMYDAGIVVVFAAGNGGLDMDHSSKYDESELSTVIGVGGLNEKNDYWPRADFGSNLDIIAPAGGNPGVTVLAGMGMGGEEELSKNYKFWGGCSFASPLIAGVAALILAENPHITPAQVRTILISTADKVGGEYANYNAEGFDSKRLYGKVHAEKAVALARTY